MSLHFWGEYPIGNWMCTVSYCSTIGKVKVSNVKVVLYGTKSTSDSVKKIPVFRLSIAFLCIVIVVKISGTHKQYLVTTALILTVISITLQCLVNLHLL